MKTVNIRWNVELETWFIAEIETQFESQLGFDVFNYSNNGKPIDIIYMPDMKLEKQIAKKLQQPIINFQVQLLAEQDNGYIRDWQIHAKLPPEKHTAYAFQWFSLAATLTILIFWISFKTKKYE